MSRKFDGKSDWYEIQRIATGLNVVGEGAGHSPVSLSASAETVMTVGESDDPQEITLDVQDANEGWFGPKSGSAEVPTFRLIDTADLSAAGMMGVPSFTFGTTNAEGSSASLVRCDASLAVFDATAPTTIEPDDAGAAGTAAFAARRDHEHPIACAAPATSLHQSSTNAEGTATSFARSDHWHAVTSSNNPGSSASILASAADGGLQLVRLGIGTDPDTDNAVKVADNTWVGLGSGAGRIILDSTPNPDQVQLAAADLYLPASHGIIHADGVTAGYVLRADGTRYVPGSVAIGDVTDLDGVQFVTMAAAAALSNERVLTAGDGIALTDGGAGAAATLAVDLVAAWSGLEFDGGDLRVDQDAAFTWAAVHTHEANVVLDDGSGDSPTLQLVGGSNDDTVSIFLDDDATAGDSGLVVKLCDTSGDSKLVVQDSGGNPMAYIDSNGNLDAASHAAFGGAASISPNIIGQFYESMTKTSSTIYGSTHRVGFDPGANFSTVVHGVYGTVEVGTAKTQTAGALNAVYGLVYAENGVAAADLAMRGGHFSTDVEDAGATTAYGVLADTPSVDGGSCAVGAGVYVNEGTVGGGSVTTLYGLYIEAITAGDTNYSLYSAGGAGYHAGNFDIGGNLTVTGTITDGGTDPPYLLFDPETREEVEERVRRNVPTEKLAGAVLFYNADAGRMEIWMPATGEYRDLAGTAVGTGEPLAETFPAVTRYALNRATGEVEGKAFADPEPKYALRGDCELDRNTGVVYRVMRGEDGAARRTGEVVPPEEAVVAVAGGA